MYTAYLSGCEEGADVNQHGEYVGSCKTLAKNVIKLRGALRRRGPWAKAGGLRAYHDRLLLEVARARPSTLNLDAFREPDDDGQ